MQIEKHESIPSTLMLFTAAVAPTRPTRVAGSIGRQVPQPDDTHLAATRFPDELP